MNKNIQTIKNILSKTDKKIYKFYFVGIGGVSMFSLAIYLKNLNQEVSGTDASVSENTKALQSWGIPISFKHKSENVIGVDFVIYSYAVEHSLEVKKAKELKICTISRAELLGLILKCYNTPICIAGAHGKSTTTALIYHVLKTAGLNPCLHLGANLQDSKKSYDYNEHIVNNDKNSMNCENVLSPFVCEACEYKDAFLNFKPKVAVVLNMAPEHLDYYKTFAGVKKSFQKFSSNANMLICADSLKLNHKNKTTFGLQNGDIVATKIKMNKNGTYSFVCLKKGKFFAHINSNLIGEHNVKNALACIAVCDSLGVGKKQIKNALSTFKGITRRFEILNNNRFIVHDYAHHPEEISAVLSEVKKFCNKKILVVFQPHTYTRTLTLMSGFVSALNLADEVAIYRTYSARENYIKGGSAKELAINIGEKSIYFNNVNDLKDYVIKKRKNWAVLFLGAGSIYGIAKNISKLC